jgi:peptidoglycan/xylan/chitin deacetylase (PgdA/CDA1 family)
MVRFLLLSLALFFTGCSSSVIQSDETQWRAPAQSVEDEEMAKLFAFHWEKSNRNFSVYVDRLIAVFYRSHKYSLDFDKELEQRIQNKATNGDIEPMTNSEAYKKLYVMKNLTYKTHDKIVYLYGRFLEKAYDPNSTGEEKAKAHGLMADLFKSIRLQWTKNPLGHLAMLDLFNELQAAQREFTSTRVGLKTTPQLQSDLNFINKKPDDYYKSFDQARQKLEVEANKEALKTDAEFEQEFKNTDFTVEREPQQRGKVFAPGESSSGNMTGGNFPQGTWALTYDDGPHASYTPMILDMLKKNGVKATFFWLSQLAPSYPNIVKRAQSEGHELENHSHSHADLSQKGANRQKEIVTSTAVLQKVYGSTVRFFRCPYGSCIINGSTSGSQEARRLIAQQKMIHVLWNVDSNDWKSDTPDAIYRRTALQVNNLSRGVVLFHDIRERSYLSSKMLVENVLKQKRTVRLDTVVDEINGK